jgi:hypothetical protein
VTAPFGRSSLALAGARAAIDDLDPGAHPEDIAAGLIEGWGATEGALRALLGGAPLAGRDLISALRQRNLLTLDQAHALAEFLAARDRASRTDYRPGAGDIEAARSALLALDAGHPASRLDVPQLADTRMFQTVTPPPAASAGAGTAGAAPPPATGLPPHVPTGRASGDRMPHLVVALAGLALVAAIAGAIWMWRTGRLPGGGASAALEDGIAAYRSGRLELARREFADVARDHPEDALPHIWLARVARDQRDDRAAAIELSRAERLEPRSPIVHREIGSFHLARARYDQARMRYTRAVELSREAGAADSISMGWLGCSLVRLGRLEEGQRWLQRAGPGDWTRCAAQTPVPGTMPGATVPGAPPVR